MSTINNDEHYPLTKPSISMKLIPEVHSISQTSLLSSSKTKEAFVVFDIIDIGIDQVSKRSSTVSQPKGTITYTV